MAGRAEAEPPLAAAFAGLPRLAGLRPFSHGSLPQHTACRTARRTHLLGAPIAQELLRLLQLLHRQRPVQVVKQLRCGGGEALELSD